MYFEIDDYNALERALNQMSNALAREVSEDAVFTCRLVASELLSNVLQHGGGRAFFRAEKRGSRVLISVRGEEEFCPPEASTLAPVDAERGRGLFLVDFYCEKRTYCKEEGIRVEINVKEI